MEASDAELPIQGWRVRQIAVVDWPGGTPSLLRAVHAGPFEAMNKQIEGNGEHTHVVICTVHVKKYIYT